MPITSYATLKAAIAAFLDVSTADISAVADDIITIAEKRIWHECRTKEMEMSLSATISISTVALPTDYIDLKFAYYVDSSNQGHELRKEDAQFMFSQYPVGSATGRPKLIGTQLSTFIFKPEPDVATYLLKGVYYGRTTPVSTSANPLFSANPDLYLYAALCESEPVLGRDPRMPLWESKYRQIKARVNNENTSGMGYTIGHYL